MSFRVCLIAVLLVAGPRVLRAQEPPAPESDDAVAIAVAREIESGVAKLRGLEFKAPTSIGIHTREELKSFLAIEIETEMPEVEVDAQRRALTLLGLCPQDLDLRRLFLDLLEEQVAGYYDPAKKSLFLIHLDGTDRSGDTLRRITMSHELVHALQDQHFDLTKLLSIEGNDDRVSAVKSLIEGDATLLMMLYENPKTPLDQFLSMMPTTRRGLEAMIRLSGTKFDDLGLPGGDSLGAAPAVVADQMIFEYFGGAQFCNALVNRRADGTFDMSGIDAAFRRPPASTEQILHPEKYTQATPDWPSDVKLPDLTAALGDGAAMLCENVLGELHVRTWLTEHGLKSRAVKTIHSGWDGDRYVAWRLDEDHDALVWFSIWDTEEDAVEFEDAARNVAAKRHAARDEQDGSFTADGFASGVRRDGVRVLVFENIPARAASAVIEATFAKTVVAEFAPAAKGN